MHTGARDLCRGPPPWFPTREAFNRHPPYPGFTILNYLSTYLVRMSGGGTIKKRG